MRYYPSFTSVLQYEESMKNKPRIHDLTVEVLGSRTYRRSNMVRGKPISWLPVDSRLFLPLLNFGHVKGLARVFLEIEIVLSLLVVLGTLAIVVLRFFR